MVGRPPTIRRMADPWRGPRLQPDPAWHTSVIALVGWIALSDGLSDRNGKPIGTDFSSFYAAGSLVLDGRAGDVYNMAAHYAREQQIFGAATPYYGWLYPPIFLLLVGPARRLAVPAGAGGLANRQLCILPHRDRGFIVGGIGGAKMAIGSTWLVAAAGFPAVFDQFRPRSERFSHRRIIWARRCWRCPHRPLWPACCSVFSPISRNLRWSSRLPCLPPANGARLLPHGSP